MGDGNTGRFPCRPVWGVRNSVKYTFTTTVELCQGCIKRRGHATRYVCTYSALFKQYENGYESAKIIHCMYVV